MNPDVDLVCNDVDLADLDVDIYLSDVCGVLLYLLLFPDVVELVEE